MRLCVFFATSIPEAINTLIGQRKAHDSSIRKVAADMAVPFDMMEETLLMYERSLKERSLSYAVFGHIGDGNLHVNILPASEADVVSGAEVVEQFACHVVSLGGSVSAEHGIGRTKKALLAIQYSPEVLADMRNIKQLFDPQGILNPGVLF